MIDFLDNTADQLVAMLSDRDAKTAEAIILADDKLKPVFGADSVGMFKLAGIVGAHLG